MNNAIVRRGYDRFPVMIVGGGPVGLALAVELGVRGVECLLVERGDGTVSVPKMSQLTTRTMEFCRRWGIAEEVKKASWPESHPTDFVFLTSLVGHELFRQKFPFYGGRGGIDYTPEGSRQCPQIFFDPIVLKRALSLPRVTIRHSTRLDSFREDSAGVHARITDLESGKSETLTANFLVGCDGFDGPVRRALGIDMQGSGILSFSVSIFFKSRELASVHDKGWARFYRPVDAGGHWGDLVSIDGRELWRLTILDLDPETDMESFDVEGYMRRAAGTVFPYEVISVLPWKRRDLVAEHYRRGRVFIAGDAAHQCSPTGGLGMNTGIGDAVDLGWKLAAVLQGWGGEGLLDAYEAERRPVAVNHVSNSTRQYQKITSFPGAPGIAEDTAEGERLRRWCVEQYHKSQGGGDPVTENTRLGYCYEQSPIIRHDGTQAPPENARGFIPTARPGTRAPHAWVSEGRSILDLFGDGFVLLRFGYTPVNAAGLVDAAASRGVPLQVVDIDDPEIEELYARRLVLVRPDGHVAWRDDVFPEDTLGLIDQVRGAAGDHSH